MSLLGLELVELSHSAPSERCGGCDPIQALLARAEG